MNKKNFIAILLAKHLEADESLEKKAFKLSNMRYKRKDFIEGYKYALLEVQSLVETFNGQEIKENDGQTKKIDTEFLEQIKFKGKTV